MNSLSRGSFSDSYQHFWGPHYELVLNILGSTGIIFPIGDPDFGKSDASTFTSFGEAAFACTPREDDSDLAIDAWANPFDQTSEDSYQGIMPIITADGTVEGNVINVGSDASIDDVFNAGGSAGWWVNLASAGGSNSGRLFSKSTSVGWQVYTTTAVSDLCGLLFGKNWTTTIGTWSLTSKAIPIGTWTFITITYNGASDANDAIIYLDGDAKGLTIVRPVGTIESDASVDGLLMNLSTTGNRTFGGSMAGGPLGPFFCKTVLSVDQVKRLYNLGRKALMV